MDYIKLYYTLCTYCKETPIKERISRRDPSDVRLTNTVIYVENHHIIPRHAGGTNDSVNMVKLLPEEHYIAHLIRWYAYNDRNDFLSIRFMINGYINKKFPSGSIPVGKINKMVSSFKNEVYHFRKNSTWHTEDGLRRISESRKGMIPVKVNGKIISVPVDHPKVLNGEWRHLTTGYISVFDLNGNKTRITTTDYHKNRNLYKPNVGSVVGINNPRYSGYTDDDLVNYVIEFTNSVNCGYIIPYHVCRRYYYLKHGYNLPKSISRFRFNGRKTTGLHDKVSELCGLEYDPYIMNKRKIRIIIEEKIKELLKK